MTAKDNIDLRDRLDRLADATTRAVSAADFLSVYRRTQYVAEQIKASAIDPALRPAALGWTDDIQATAARRLLEMRMTDPDFLKSCLSTGLLAELRKVADRPLTGLSLVFNLFSLGH